MTSSSILIEADSLNTYFDDIIGYNLQSDNLYYIDTSNTLRTIIYNIIVKMFNHTKCIIHESVVGNLNLELNYKSIYLNSIYSGNAICIDDIKPGNLNLQLIDFQPNDHMNTIFENIKQYFKDDEISYFNASLQLSIKEAVRFFKLENFDKIFLINGSETIYVLKQLMLKNNANLHNLTYNAIDIDEQENATINDIFTEHIDKIITIKNTYINTTEDVNNCDQILKIIDDNLGNFENSHDKRVLLDIRSYMEILQQQINSTSHILMETQENLNQLQVIQDACNDSYKRLTYKGW